MPLGPGEQRGRRPTAWHPPEEFDEYRLLRPLGRGGMGQVHLAQDTYLDRQVAVKFIASLEPNPTARARFRTEARAAARLVHPNVVTVHRVGEVDGHPYLVSEFVRGTSLDRLPRPIPWRRALELGIGLARGLAAAHRHGVLHRDLKPANIVVGDGGEAKLIDFGIARLLDAPEPLVDPADAPAAAAPGVSPTDTTAPLPAPRAGAAAAPPAAASAPAALTAADVVLGTPHYLPPESWRGEPASPRGDVYALGVVLYELCAGSPPHAGTPLEELRQRVLAHDAPPLAATAAGVDPRFGGVVDRCLARDPEARYASGEEVRAALEELCEREVTVAAGNPYRGLRPFEAEHRALFFGRGREIHAVVDRLRHEPFVLVAGDSGVGKSSLCRAGVLPALAEALAIEGPAWTTITLVPGPRPMAALLAALAPVLGIDEETLAARAATDPEALARELRRTRRAAGGVVLFVDQLEELLTVADAAQAQAFAEALGGLAVPAPGIRLLGTARGDFVTRLAALAGLGDQLERALFLLRPLSLEGVRDAIVGPARASGVRFESETLLGGLVAAATTTRSGLPLLQFALAELWEARDRARRLITADALVAIGGVAGALARHADGVLAGLTPPARRAARRVLLRLITPEGTRARRSESELGLPDDDARTAVAALVQGRLLCATGVSGEAAYELAHEALVSGWDTLRAWLAEAGDTRAVRARVLAATEEWERLGRTRDALYGRLQLAETAALVPEDLAPREAEFLRTSRAALRRGRLARRAVAVAVPLAVALVYGGVELRARSRVTSLVAGHEAEARGALGEARQASAAADAARSRAFARFDARAGAEGERLWDESRALAARAERGFARASQSLETALQLDSHHRGVRALLADLLHQRALLADRERRAGQRDELLQRLALYDEGGARRRDLERPGEIVVSCSPPATSVQLARFERDAEGRRRLLPVADLGETPVETVVLAPGSYLLALAATGRAPVRYPFVLGRGERLEVAVTLPREADVPPGYVAVPAGRFLFGSTADDSMRRGFYNTAPLHEVRTGDYLIGRTEVTYAEYLEYLRALPPAARDTHRPRAGGGGLAGSLALTEVKPGQWELTLLRSRARAGEKLRFPARSTRAAQDWLKLPVSGVTARDAEAYAAWLDSSGRLPGARLCTDLEWERAARGADDREFPHGDVMAPDDANYDETYGKRPTTFGPDEVGAHPASRSPFGLEDAAGNVWEWVTSSVGSPEERALRGGAYYFNPNALRVFNREVSEPLLRDSMVGLRVCSSGGTRRGARNQPH
jgi:serine/threonine protein kinase/formylglycine-generating enzyme required for sulfatase activity